MAKELHRIEIEPAENGGHVVRHHYREMAKDNKSHSGIREVYHEPESHVFGKSEGHKMLAHVANHLKIAEPQGEGAEGEETEEEGNE